MMLRRYDKTEVLIDTDKIHCYRANGIDFENSNGYLVEVVNKTDTNIFIQPTDTAAGAMMNSVLLTQLLTPPPLCIF